MSGARRRWPFAVAALAVALAVAAGCAERRDGGPTASVEHPSASVTTTATAPDRLAVIRDQHLFNVPLTTQEGRSVRFYDDLVRGRVVAINFMFTSCVVGCPVTISNLVLVQKALDERARRDVTFLTISLDPERDTPDVLRSYARAYHAGPGWYFLTGKLSDIERLRHGLGAYDPDPRVDADREQHVGIVILGNEPQGRWKAISALSKPVRIRQAIDRTILPPGAWPTGAAVVREAPYEVRERVEPFDRAALPRLD
jgi:protein SCO1